MCVLLALVFRFIQMFCFVWYMFVFALFGWPHVDAPPELLEQCNHLGNTAFSSWSLFESVYLLMHWSDCNAVQERWFCRPSSRHDYLLIARASYATRMPSHIHAANVHEEPRRLVTAVVAGEKSGTSTMFKQTLDLLLNDGNGVFL
jgi:hypothetical protein